MLKKFLILALIIAFSSTVILAAESEPSNTVGFISFEASAGNYVPFAAPFTYYTEGHVQTTALASIIGGNWFSGNPATGDRIWCQNNFYYATLINNNWTGSLTQVTPGYAYWAFVRTGNPLVTAVTAGEVDMTPLNVGTMAVGFYTPVGLREPGTVMLPDANLLNSGFTGGTPANADRIWDQNTFYYAFYNTITSSWSGSLVATGLIGGHALWIYVNPTHTSFEWTYIPQGAPNPGPESVIIQPPAAQPNPNPDQILRRVDHRYSPQSQTSSD